LCVLAAAYGFGLARNHSFTDGNRRTAWVALRMFLRRNQMNLRFGELDAIKLVQSLAAGNLTEDELVEWLRLHLH
jgi:death-on-curing protein